VQAALKAKGLPWERAKAFDGAAVLSPFVPFNGDIAGLSLRLSINGDVVQEGRVVDMINSPAVLLAEANTFLSFEDNDILMTGTPEGVGLVKAGAHFLGQIFQGDVLLAEQHWMVSAA
jgi:2-keto-4-pentenoate hydratase/2-oxohepta-3-ene-1,7-dioic acid hydratase in catechol pathway